MKKVFLILLIFIFMICGCNATKATGPKQIEKINKGGDVTMSEGVTKIKYLGHGSLKLYLPNGKICYIDPYAGDDYSDKADLVLITHQHSDHNKLDLLTTDSNTIIFQNQDAIGKNGYNNVEFFGMKIEPVEAYNKNHKKEECVGYILRINNKTIYVAGDTSKTNKMHELAAYNIDYAFLPMDGIYNMEVDEAIECAKLIGAKHTIPYHIAPGKLFDEVRANKFNVPSRLIIKPNDIINIE